MTNFFSFYNQRRVVTAAVAGTTMMTLYSYVISLARQKNFKEPVLLDKLITRLVPVADTKDSRVTGWAMHYLVGLLFAETYAPFWRGAQHVSNAKKGLILGGFSGIAAILIWKFTLDAHPLPPKVDFVRFAGQLFIAHLVFGLFSALAFNSAA